jgi:predicted metallopeptidase
MAKKKKRPIRYEKADDIQENLAEIVGTLSLRHIDLERVACVRSYGSSTKKIIARCHGMSKVLQLAMGVKAFYVLEFISERFDKLDANGQVETIIHELMHIPKNFGGGFRHHDHVSRENVESMHKRYRKAKSMIVDD